MLIPLWAQVDSVSGQMRQVDVGMTNAAHLSLCQEACNRTVEPPPAPFDAVCRPSSLPSPIQSGQNERKKKPGSGEHPEDFSQVRLHFPKEIQAVAALPTQAVSTEVNNQDVGSWSFGPERPQHWKQLLPESASSALPTNPAAKAKAPVEPLLTDVSIQPSNN